MKNRENPYQGLHAFSEEDAPYFFGREADSERLWETVQGQRLVALLGASGSGKSSLAFAGLSPRARAAGWTRRRAARRLTGKKSKRGVASR